MTYSFVRGDRIKNMEFVQILEEAQKRLGFRTKKDFAEFLEIDQGQLGRYMKGGEEPGYVTLKKVADKLSLEILAARPMPYTLVTPGPTTEKDLRVFLSRYPDLDSNDIDEIVRYVKFRVDNPSGQ